MNHESSEIFSPDDLNRFQLSPSDKKNDDDENTGDDASDLETESTVPKAITSK
jgi:hypothetical protein